MNIYEKVCEELKQAEDNDYSMSRFSISEIASDLMAYSPTFDGCNDEFDPGNAAHREELIKACAKWKAAR